MPIPCFLHCIGHGFTGSIRFETANITVGNRLPTISTTISAQGSGNTAFNPLNRFRCGRFPTLPTITYSWTNSQGLLGRGRAQADLSMGGMGEVITCTAVATDLTGAGASDTDTYQISGSAPVISQIVLALPSFKPIHNHSNGKCI